MKRNTQKSLVPNSQNTIRNNLLFTTKCLKITTYNTQKPHIYIYINFLTYTYYTISHQQHNFKLIELHKTETFTYSYSFLSII